MDKENIKKDSAIDGTIEILKVLSSNWFFTRDFIKNLETKLDLIEKKLDSIENNLSKRFDEKISDLSGNSCEKLENINKNLDVLVKDLRDDIKEIKNYSKFFEKEVKLFKIFIAILTSLAIIIPVIFNVFSK
jgi:methyl-accepting chemotaxis protein